MFMDIYVSNSCFSKISCIAWNVISLDFNYRQDVYKMRVSWEFNIYNLF